MTPPINLGILASSAAGLTSSFDYLTGQAFSGSTQVSITGLDSYTNYRHLQFRVTAKRNTVNTTPGDLNFRINNNTSSIYDGAGLFSRGQILNTQYDTESEAKLSFTMPGTNSYATSAYAYYIIDLYDFLDSSKATSFTARACGPQLNGEKPTVFWHNGYIRDNNAVSSLQFSTASNGFVVGSQLEIYGIKAEV